MAKVKQDTTMSKARSPSSAFRPSPEIMSFHDVFQGVHAGGPSFPPGCLLSWNVSHIFASSPLTTLSLLATYSSSSRPVARSHPSYPSLSFLLIFALSHSFASNSLLSLVHSLLLLAPR